MPPEFLVPVIIVFIVIGLPVMSVTLIKLAKIMKGDTGGSKKNRNHSDRQEAELMQEINQCVQRLEKRIDALETIVIERKAR